MTDRDIHTMTLKQAVNAYKETCDKSLELIELMGIYKKDSLEHDRVMEQLYANKERIDDILGYMKMIASGNKQSMAYVANIGYPLMEKLRKSIETKDRARRMLKT